MRSCKGAAAPTRCADHDGEVRVGWISSLLKRVFRVQVEYRRPLRRRELRKARHRERVVPNQFYLTPLWHPI